jgi:hypothetical protein
MILNICVINTGSSLMSLKRKKEAKYDKQGVFFLCLFHIMELDNQKRLFNLAFQR